MGFRRTFKDKLKMAKRAGLPVERKSVDIINSVSSKNLKKNRIIKR